jgi:hypothetical protein
MLACSNHPESPAETSCGRCMRPFCALCLVTLKGVKFCGECKAAAARVQVAPPADEGPAEECQLASEALKYAIVSLFCCGPVLGPMAISKGMQAKGLIADNPRLAGDGKATAAIVIGSIGLTFWVLGMLAQFAEKAAR